MAVKYAGDEEKTLGFDNNHIVSNENVRTSLFPGSYESFNEKGLDMDVPDKIGGFDTTIVSIRSMASSGSIHHPVKRDLSLWSNDSEDAEVAAPVQSPAKRGNRIYRFLRWNFFSAYRRLFTMVFVANISVLVALLVRPGSGPDRGLTLQGTINATSANLLLSILMRQEHVVNLLFLLSSSLRPATPLRMRRWLAKIYSYGGLHSGCGVAAVVWYLAFACLVTKHLVIEPYIEPAIAAITYIILCLFALIVAFAHPTLRARLHDYFETTHRFAGWTVVILFWVQVVLTAHYDAMAVRTSSLGRGLILLPSFWSLIIITLCIVYPWARLRSRAVRAEYLSSHAIRLHFDTIKLDYCMTVRLSDNPIKETHAFAAIPNPNGATGFSVVVSNAGDWTSRMIQQPPAKLWIRGAPTYNVLRVAVMFKRVLVVATGSGIGPCLSLFHGRPDLHCRILWSGSSPVETFGLAVIEDVLKTDPKAVIIDSKKAGRPDMVSLTYRIVKESKCEAVFVVSNPKVTRKVVYGMETRGVPAYGPIFDS